MNGDGRVRRLLADPGGAHRGGGAQGTTKADERELVEAGIGRQLAHPCRAGTRQSVDDGLRRDMTAVLNSFCGPAVRPATAKQPGREGTARAASVLVRWRWRREAVGRLRPSPSLLWWRPLPGAGSEPALRTERRNDDALLVALGSHLGALVRSGPGRRRVPRPARWPRRPSQPGRERKRQMTPARRPGGRARSRRCSEDAWQLARRNLGGRGEEPAVRIRRSAVAWRCRWKQRQGPGLCQPGGACPSASSVSKRSWRA